MSELSPGTTQIKRLSHWEPPSPHDLINCACQDCRIWRADQRRGWIDMPEPEWRHTR